MLAFIILFGKNKACIFCQKVFKIYFQILTNCPFVILYNIPLQEINVKNRFFTWEFVLCGSKCRRLKERHGY